MFTLVQHNDDIPWLKSWLLVSLSMENNLLAISHSCGIEVSSHVFVQFLFNFKLIFSQSHLDQLSLYSHLCRRGPPRSSSVAWSSGLHMLYSGLCGWLSVLGLDSRGTLWTLAVPYLEVAGAHGPACLCHGKTCTPVPLLSDSRDLLGKK